MILPQRVDSVEGLTKRAIGFLSRTLGGRQVRSAPQLRANSLPKSLPKTLPTMPN
jgi:hypothetical protein